MCGVSAQGAGRGAQPAPLFLPPPPQGQAPGKVPPERDSQHGLECRFHSEHPVSFPWSTILREFRVSLSARQRACLVEFGFSSSLRTASFALCVECMSPDSVLSVITKHRRAAKNKDQRKVPSPGCRRSRGAFGEPSICLRAFI